MADALNLLWLPFLLSLVLVGIHAWLGLQVIARNIIFVDLALAQIAALGATLAFMLGHPVNSIGSYGYSLLFTCCAAMLLAATRNWSGRIPQEALIGVIYVVSAAAGFLLVDKAPQGTEHIKQVLTGNILTSGAGELLLITPIYIVIGAALWAVRARLAHPGAGWHGWFWDFFFYASFGVVVTSSVALAGVLLVFSFLIVPAAIGVLYAASVGRQLVIGWITGAVASVAGLAASYVWDLPTGSAMVCTFGAALVLAGLAWPVLKGGSRNARVLVHPARICIAAVAMLSGAWIVAAPRADQPLLDSLEYVAPALRTLYLNARELEIWRDADEYAKRYQRQAEQLNEREAKSRWQGEALPEAEVRRISSFLKSYNEMRKGEEFVKREVRVRAFERTRWVIGAILLLLGVLLFPWRLRSAARPSEGANQR